MNRDAVLESTRCPWCGDDTAWGSGKFVNRLSTYTDAEAVDWLTEEERAAYRFVDTYACAECIAVDCEKCNKPIELDNDIYDKDETGKYHPECLPLSKWSREDLELFDEWDLEEQQELIKLIKENN
jgi:hypothetical protein